MFSVSRPPTKAVLNIYLARDEAVGFKDYIFLGSILNLLSCHRVENKGSRLSLDSYHPIPTDPQPQETSGGINSGHHWSSREILVSMNWGNAISS